MGMIELVRKRSGVYFGCGGAAISLAYAPGGLALAPHFIGGNGTNPEFLCLLNQWFANLDF